MKGQGQRGRGQGLETINNDLARASPSLKGRAADRIPQGGSPPPARFFSLCVLGQGLWDSSIPAILSVFDAFWSYDLNLFIFPKTAAGPGASEKPGGHLERLLRALAV